MVIVWFIIFGLGLLAFIEVFKDDTPFQKESVKDGTAAIIGIILVVAGLTIMRIFK